MGVGTPKAQPSEFQIGVTDTKRLGGSEFERAGSEAHAQPEFFLGGCVLIAAAPVFSFLRLNEVAVCTEHLQAMWLASDYLLALSNSKAVFVFTSAPHIPVTINVVYLQHPVVAGTASEAFTTQLLNCSKPEVFALEASLCLPSKPFLAPFWPDAVPARIHGASSVAT